MVPAGIRSPAPPDSFADRALAQNREAATESSQGVSPRLDFTATLAATRRQNFRSAAPFGAVICTNTHTQRLRAGLSSHAALRLWATARRPRGTFSRRCDESRFRWPLPSTPARIGHH